MGKFFGVVGGREGGVGGMGRSCGLRGKERWVCDAAKQEKWYDMAKGYFDDE